MKPADGSITFGRFYINLTLLEGIAEAWDLQLAVSQQKKNWLAAFQSFATKIRETVGHLLSPPKLGKETSRAPGMEVYVGEPNCLRLFKDAQQHAYTRYKVAENQHLPIPALIEAARYFSTNLPESGS